MRKKNKMKENTDVDSISEIKEHTKKKKETKNIQGSMVAASLLQDSCNSKAQPEEIREAEKTKKKKHKKNKSFVDESTDCELNLEGFSSSFQHSAERKCDLNRKDNRVSLPNILCHKGIDTINECSKSKKAKKSKKKSRTRDHTVDSDERNDEIEDSASCNSKSNKTMKPKEMKRLQNERKGSELLFVSTDKEFKKSKKAKKHVRDLQENEVVSGIENYEGKDSILCATKENESHRSKKREKRKLQEILEEDEMDEELCRSNKARRSKKKARNHDMDFDVISDENNDSVCVDENVNKQSLVYMDEENKKKKKRKKRKDEDNCDKDLVTMNDKKAKKKHKEDNIILSEDGKASSDKSNKKKKKCATATNGCELEHSMFSIKKKKSKQDQSGTNDTGSSGEEPLYLEENEVKQETKKKKKRNKREDETGSDENLIMMNEKKTEIKSERQHNPQSEEDKASNNKSKKHREKCAAATNSSELEHGENKVASKNKKKKKHKQDQAETDVPNSLGEQQHKEHMAQKKARTEDGAREICSDSLKSKTIPISTIETSAFASQPGAGQWQGDLFDNADRQNKFLRLLGGMKKKNGSEGTKTNRLFKTSDGVPKKGLFGSLASRVGGASALSASDAVHLNQRLEEDYNKALDLKLSGKKGTGFGFVPDPAEGKKFHIDINKTNSIKFE